jgi:DNA gyrase inhibitor GyrI
MKTKTIFAACLLICAALLFISEVPAEEKEKPQVQIEQKQSHAVLYTIYRGPYDAVGEAIGTLYQTAGKNGIRPAGQMHFVYLNNPRLVDSAHWLTEIRIEVGDDALKHEGKLGKWIDVKRIPPLQMAVITKPAGIEDPSDVYLRLAQWLYENEYYILESFQEAFGGAMTQNYQQMETRIMVPVEKKTSN